MTKVFASAPPASQPSQPMSRPAMIQPIVPNTRIDGNCFSGLARRRKEIEFASARVGMKDTIASSASTKNGPNSSCRPARNSMTALTTCSTPRIRWAAKKRSAMRPTMNGARIAPRDWVRKAREIWLPLACRSVAR
nr:hypothetical protein [Brachybacterium sp. SGAir0954]